MIVIVFSLRVASQFCVCHSRGDLTMCRAFAGLRKCYNSLIDNHGLAKPWRVQPSKDSYRLQLHQLSSISTSPAINYCSSAIQHSVSCACGDYRICIVQSQKNNSISDETLFPSKHDNNCCILGHFRDLLSVCDIICIRESKSKNIRRLCHFRRKCSSSENAI